MQTRLGDEQNGWKESEDDGLQLLGFGRKFYMVTRFGDGAGEGQCWRLGVAWILTEKGWFGFVIYASGVRLLHGSLGVWHEGWFWCLSGVEWTVDCWRR